LLIVSDNQHFGLIAVRIEIHLQRRDLVEESGNSRAKSQNYQPLWLFQERKPAQPDDSTFMSQRRALMKLASGFSLLLPLVCALDHAHQKRFVFLICDFLTTLCIRNFLTFMGFGSAGNSGVLWRSG
jgi:hypothetical protein